MTIRCRVGDTTATTAKINAVALSTTEITATCSGGSVSVSTPDDRYNDGGVVVASALVTITGLSAFTEYTYTITQGSESVSGSFMTIVNDQTTDFGLIMSTCDRGGEFTWNRKRAYTAVKKVMQESSEPITTIFHIDDLCYFDGYNVQDTETGVGDDGEPQLTGLSKDYAAAYAAYYGLLPSESGWRYADRQWVYRNLSCVASGGDHAIELNHCRGQVGAGDYLGCNKTLEATAVAEWDAFVGNGNPPMLRSGKWHWGKVIGSIRFALFDYSLYSVPYDPPINAPDPIGYGAEQLGDIRTYMNVDTEPFKCFLFESNLSVNGQPWYDWHNTEASAWKTEFDGTANYTAAGTSFMAYGDNHSPHVVSYDTTWAFCAGMIENSRITNVNMEDNSAVAVNASIWGGQNRWSMHANVTTGDRAVSGFWHFRVLQSESPKRITAEFKDSGTGNTISPIFTLLEGATDNQWTVSKAKFG